MKLSVLKEAEKFESRVAATPESTESLIKIGFEVFIEKDAGIKSGFLNADYKLAGAKIVDRTECLKSSDIILTVQFPLLDDIKKINSKKILIGILDPYKNKKHFNLLNESKITSIGMELVPRISRSQSMDVLSSQANLAGYRSIIDAAEEFNKVFPMMMTAAGRINPAKIMVLGAGVAGLQAIATAKRLGSVVCATDVRPAAKEQVESLGAKFIMVEDSETKEAETSKGYAKEMSEEYKKKQANLIEETIAKQDNVICTALIPGKKAPILITEEMVEKMKPGSVIIDLAVEAGGNCPLSKLNEKVIHNNVKILGYPNVPSRVAKDASSLYAKNLFNFISLIINKENKKIEIDWDDEIIKSVVLTHDGNIQLEEFK